VEFTDGDREELAIVGSESAAVGVYYAGSGGVSPYTYAISCGSIDALGRITDLTGCCGTGTVSVTDDCGNTASMEVRYPTGRWVFISTENFPEFNDGSPASSKTTYIGGKRYTEYDNVSRYYYPSSLHSVWNIFTLKCVPDGGTRPDSVSEWPGVNSMATTTTIAIDNLTHYDCTNGCYCYNIASQTLRYRVYRRDTYEWQC
jgi:hypothetical protein